MVMLKPRLQVQLSLTRDPKVTAQLIGEVLDWAHEFKVIRPKLQAYKILTNLCRVKKSILKRNCGGSRQQYVNVDESIQRTTNPKLVRHGTKLLNSRGSGSTRLSHGHPSLIRAQGN